MQHLHCCVNRDTEAIDIVMTEVVWESIQTMIVIAVEAWLIVFALTVVIIRGNRGRKASTRLFTWTSSTSLILSSSLVH